MCRVEPSADPALGNVERPPSRLGLVGVVAEPVVGVVLGENGASGSVTVFEVMGTLRSVEKLVESKLSDISDLYHMWWLTAFVKLFEEQDAL